MNKILVPMDDSKNSFRALDMAIELAKSNNAKIVALHVLPLPPMFSRKSLKIDIEEMIGYATGFLNAARNLAKKRNVSLETKIKDEGDPGHFVVDYAQKNNFDLIILGSRGRGSLKEMFLGSTSNYVIHKSKIPVLIVK